MKIKKLKITLQGPLWSVSHFEIEGVDVLNLWKEDSAKGEGSVTVSDFDVSSDNILDIFIRVGAPNGSSYNVVLAGQTATPSKKIDYTEEGLVVKKSGRLNILLSKNIDDII